jgi:hypothetical protein
MYSDSIDSNCCTFGPVPTHPDRSESTTSAISCSPITGLPKIKKLSRINLDVSVESCVPPARADTAWEPHVIPAATA